MLLQVVTPKRVVLAGARDIMRSAPPPGPGNSGVAQELVFHKGYHEVRFLTMGYCAQINQTGGYSIP